MGISGITKIHKCLNTLREVLTDLLPANAIHIDVFDYNLEITDEIYNVISKITAKTSLLRDERIKRIETAKEFIRKECKLLNISEPSLLIQAPLPIIELFIENELQEIKSYKLRRVAVIENAKKTIKNLKNELGEENDSEIDLVGLNLEEMVEKLKNIKQNLEIELDLKESLREQHLERIAEIHEILDRENQVKGNEKIKEIERIVRNLESVLERRMDEQSALTKEIQEMEKDLEYEKYQISDKLDDTTILSMKGYLEYLREDHKRKFNEIFMKIKNEFKEASEIFGQAAREYPETDEGLAEMRVEITKLLPKKKLYIEILNKVERRKMLLVKMLEFEKIASDPKRLFKSSFQLNSEEKFRNSAYPTLLKLEEMLFSAIERYEEEFDLFKLEGKPYRDILRDEIERRIINRTVFISRCDSPYRKKQSNQ